jgi:hypothetical protein
VGNKSQGFAVAVADLPLAHNADIAQATEIAVRVAAEVAEDPEVAEQLIEAPEVVGIEKLGPEGVTFRVTARTSPGQQFGVQRALITALSEAFDRAGLPRPVAFRPRRRPPPSRGDNGAVTVPRNFYDDVGGAPVFHKIVGASTRRSRRLRCCVPSTRRRTSAGRSPAPDVPRAVLGRPATYSDQRGHPRLRMRHFPFRIGPIEHDAWLRCMRIAVDEADLSPAVRDQLWQYLEYAAASMVNSPV